ncbi:MAG TPA: hypothetical protein ENJ45_04915, partial [Phaeodactylibacter sp.]|nr:hypothetical protein [Phaeodactylibacter sp.]
MSKLIAQPVTFTGSLPQTNITVSCDAVPPPDTLTAVGCTSSAPFVFLNEIHYDNQGGDTGEFIEVVGSAGFDLSACSIELYNGSNGSMYNSINLSGMIDDETMGFGAVSFPISGIQNGAPDSFALICNGAVVEFLSYEGAFTATGGTANGMMSTDIGVSEPGNTPIGQSLKRVNLFFDNPGCAIADFQWAGPDVASPGAINPGQSFDPNDCQGTSNAATVVLNEVTTPGACAGEYTIVRTWTATDACGSTAQYTQTVNVEDNTPPTFINPPADMVVDCGTPIPAAPLVLASDNCNIGSTTPSAWINELHYDNTGGDV